MQASTELKQRDTLNTQNNVDETPKQDYNSELIVRKKIEGSPFTLLHDKEKGYYLVMGNYILTQPKKTEEECMNDLYENNWNVILNMIIIVFNKATGS